MLPPSQLTRSPSCERSPIRGSCPQRLKVELRPTRPPNVDVIFRALRGLLVLERSADAVGCGATLHGGSTTRLSSSKSRRRGRGARESAPCCWSLGDKEV